MSEFSSRSRPSFRRTSACTLLRANVRRRYRRRRIEKIREGRFLEERHFQDMHEYLDIMIPTLQSAITERVLESDFPLEKEFATLYERCFLLKLMYSIGQQRTGILTVMDIVTNLEKRQSDGLYVFHPGLEKTTFLRNTGASSQIGAAGTPPEGQRMLVFPPNISAMIDFIIEYVRPILLKKKLPAPAAPAQMTRSRPRRMHSCLPREDLVSTMILSACGVSSIGFASLALLSLHKMSGARFAPTSIQRPHRRSLVTRHQHSSILSIIIPLLQGNTTICSPMTNLTSHWSSFPSLSGIPRVTRSGTAKGSSRGNVETDQIRRKRYSVHSVHIIIDLPPVDD